MPVVPEPKKQWYVVHVLSGQEKRVHDRIRREAEAQEMGDYIFDVLVPQERVEENRRGKKIETKRKFYPGYIIVNMHLFEEDGGLMDQTWYFIKEMDGVIGFAGTKDRPIPMRQREVDAMLSQINEREENIRPAITFDTGDSVKVGDGPFEGQTGVIEEIDHETGKILVSVNIFGRATPVELEAWQIEKE
ncbi:transcription termination/antitermination protein NusG [Persicirhabdus sediminis]|uniref:Transcription termination/antitermination protein NusG n=1 Tax=Persicirhabdus sediminis TaxID=454144 RepID=A0A8J7SGU5_9BACT|nr:transcription termination/antitermination protein NusG [Persicirhabdus sediminis]MBK1790350.1 transcription termination/antitermination protein NusG [Persicirhabdus sediminis]